MLGLYEKNRRSCNIVLIIMVILVSIPNVFSVKSTGLDPSWYIALNKLAAGGYTWGKDIVFTYGPLGYLTVCQIDGNNILYTTIFWTLLLGVHSYLLYQILFKYSEQTTKKQIILSLILYLLANAGGCEYYICYIAFLALLLSTNGFKKDIYIFSVLLVLSLYIKFSLFILVFVLCVVYLIFGYFNDKTLYKYCFIRIAGGIVLMPIVFFLINDFSLVGIRRYLIGSIEMASGYNTAMSSPSNNVLVIWIVVAILMFLISTVLIARSGIYNFTVMALVGTCLFMCYKHGFVRADRQHIVGAMNAMLLFLSFIPLFIHWEVIVTSIGKYKSVCVSLLSIVVLIALIQNGLSGINLLQRIKTNVFNMPLTIEEMMKQVEEEDGEDAPITKLNALPGHMLEEIGDNTVSIYPWEISYWASNDMSYVPLAGVQAYSIYTPYLDQITSNKLREDGAPEYILFSMDVIDGRWALIECPRTWETIRNNYYIKMQNDNLFLLKRREDNSEIEYQEIDNETFSLSESEIDLSGADYLKISADFNLLGILAKTFWKISKVDMQVTYMDGTVITRRVLLDMFADGVELGSLAYDSNTVKDILNDTGELSKVKSISFKGDGLKYYKDQISVNFLVSSENSNQYPNLEIKTGYAEAVNPIDIDGFIVEENSLKFNVERIEGSLYYTRVVGWAFVDSIRDNAEIGDICIEVDGTYYKCTENSRDDVRKSFSLYGDNIGFTALLRGDVNVNVCIIDYDDKIIYK